MGRTVTLLLVALLAGCEGAQSDTDPVATAGTGETSAAPTVPVPASSPSAMPQRMELSGPAKLPDRLHALGTEPFWNVRIEGTRLRYSTPEDQAGKEFTATREDSAIASTFLGTLAGKPFELSIVPEKCSDGMSDTEYPFSAWISYAGERHHGCARKGT